MLSLRCQNDCHSGRAEVALELRKKARQYVMIHIHVLVTSREVYVDRGAVRRGKKAE